MSYPFLSYDDALEFYGYVITVGYEYKTLLDVSQRGNMIIVKFDDTNRFLVKEISAKYMRMRADWSVAA